MENLLVGELRDFVAALSRNKDDENVVLGFWVDERNGVSVILLSLEHEVDPTLALAPEGFLEAAEQFVGDAVANAVDGLLVGFGQRRTELHQISLKYAQRQAGDDSLGFKGLVVGSPQHDRVSRHVNCHHPRVVHERGLAGLEQLLEHPRKTTAQRDEVVFPHVLLLYERFGREVRQIHPLDVGFQVQFPKNCILHVLVFLGQLIIHKLFQSLSY